MHLKHRNVSIPRIDRRKGVSTDRQMCRQWCLACTIQNKADDSSGEPGLLHQVQVVLNLWSVGIVGPRLELGVGHSSDVYEGGFGGGEDRGVGGGNPRMKTAAFDGRVMTGG